MMLGPQTIKQLAAQRAVSHSIVPLHIPSNNWSARVTHARHLGVVEGTSPPYGYGYGAAQYYDSALPGTSYPQTPYPAQMYGRDSLAELEGFTMGSFTDTIQSIIGAVESGAQQVTNIARGIANISQATSIVAGQAAKSGGSVFTPTPADIAAQKADVAGLLGINVNEYLLIGGGLILLLVLTHRK